MSRPLPQPTTETAPFWDAARAGRLAIQRCTACARHQFYPRPFCTACLCDDMEWIDACGRGRIYTYTICRIAANPAMADKVPYAIAMIDLEEGVRMLTQIVDSDLDQLGVGAPVEVVFESVSDDITLPQFKLSVAS
ncbi:putative OB-fold protein [Paraburkholderia sp. GAS448]|jgi:hypothetical protein|uniref:Zn-ribbon domain-containing OB-fold protein n=1 Tax=Paraburkholderia sp. GAS448 TaxID=3035136 RepID=UPI003D1BDDB0